jgi:hypothetical protein
MVQVRSAVETVQAYDPTGHARVIPVQAAARPASIAGLRPGVLANRKMHARLLLETIAGALGEHAELRAPAVESKPSNGPPTAQALEHIVGGADFALVGTSD